MLWYDETMARNHADSPPVRAADGLSVQQIRAFCAVVDASSYADAAKQLGVPVPTLWEQVQAVQRCYDAELLERHGRGIRPTTFAESLRAALEPVLVGLDSTFDLRDLLDKQKQSQLTLVAGVRMMLEDLAIPLKKFAVTAPETTLRIVHGDKTTAAQMVDQGEADLALILRPSIDPEVEKLDIVPAYDVTYLAVMPTDHPLASMSRVSLADLAAERLVLGREQTSTRKLFEQALHREGVTVPLRIAAETDNSAYASECVRAGMGVGIVAGRLPGELTKGLAFHDLTPQMGGAKIIFLSKPGRILPASAQTLINIVQQTCGVDTRLA